MSTLDSTFYVEIEEVKLSYAVSDIERIIGILGTIAGEKDKISTIIEILADPEVLTPKFTVIGKPLENVKCECNEETTRP